MEPAFHRIWDEVKPFTMTSPMRGYAVYKAVEYLERNEITGDFVECGVWKGGSCMLMALALLELSQDNRKLYLYDTFSGMTAPTSEDVIAWNNLSVQKKWDEELRGEKDYFSSWAVGLEDVKNNMRSVGYPSENINFVPGDICETLDKTAPEKIALLRLDTDWYESTVKELEVLYPLLVSGGILLIDDYGHFKGARKAVDEFFLKLGQFPYLSRSDYTGRVLVKP
ncbi:MAG: macrocin O-methyltransferase [Spirochaetales bacterium]|nr:macrocin O-methyltransferase [Spirochaetales bacterium]